MELWIRSQNKMVLRKIDNLYIAQTLYQTENGGYSIKYEGQHESIYTLGEYQTKERALEVLDEIQKKINLINLGHDFGSPMIDLKNPTYIYEMPID